MTAPPYQRPVTSTSAPHWAPDQVKNAILGGAALAGGWPVLHALAQPVPLDLLVLVAHVTGMLAGYGVVVLVGLMSRTPALERGVGADRLSRWHSTGGRAVVTLVLAHALAATGAWAGAQRESLWVAAWQVLAMPGLVAATLGTALLLAVAVLSVRAARRRVSYETWHTVHLLVYVAVALSFVHQLAGPDLAGYTVLQVAWALLYTGVFALVLEHRLLTPLRNTTRHRMRVSSVQPEGPGVVSIVVEGRDLDELQAESGQFFRWRFLTPELWATAHPFSLSAPPSSRHLRLTVKTLGDGSRRLQDLEPGTWVVAEGPYGAMTEQRRTRGDVLLLAGGVGITPMRALFESLQLGPREDLLLMYFSRTESDVLFRDELERIAACSGGRVVFLVGDVPLDVDLLRRYCPDVQERDVYFCGPPGMSRAARAALYAVGVPQVRFHEERFAL